MHGFNSGSTLLVNAEVDSMGGVIDSGVGICTQTSPCQAAIEEAQAELRLEYDVREERRRELEFLEKGGNPLDFRFGLAASVSGQSTSLTDQLLSQFVTSEAKGSFALATSPRGDSVESSGRLGATVACEPTSADNFYGQNEVIETGGKYTCPSKSNTTPCEHSSQVYGSQNLRESEDLPIFHPGKAYRRRNRSKIYRDTARLNYTDATSHGGLNSSLPTRHWVVPEAAMLEAPSDTEMDITVTTNAANGFLSEVKLDVSNSGHLRDIKNHDIKDGVPAHVTSRQPDSFMGREETNPTVGECLPCSGYRKPKDDVVHEQLSERNQLHGDGKCLQTEDVANNVAIISKGLDSESSCTQTSVSVEGNRNIDSDLCTSSKNVDSIGGQNEEQVLAEHTANCKHVAVVEGRNIAENNSCLNDNHIPQNHHVNGVPDKDEEEANKSRLSAQNEAESHPNPEEMQPNQHDDMIKDRNQRSSDASILEGESCCLDKLQGPQDPYVHELNKSDISLKLQPPSTNQTAGVDKPHEDRILEEARSIEVKRKRIKELSIGPLPKEYRRKSHWDFVLEEMAWMANDFAQERLWKRTAAAQLCHRAAFASQLKLEEFNKHRKVRAVAQTLARALMKFWQSAALPLRETGIISGFKTREHGKVACGNMDDNHNTNGVNGGHDEESHGMNIKPAIQRYVLRFIKHNSSVGSFVNAGSFETLEKASVVDMPEMTNLDKRPEADLFYVVSHGAMGAYRKSINVYMMQCERAGKNMQEEIDTLMNDALTEFGSLEDIHEEDERESVCQLPGAFEGPSKFSQKKRKNSKSYTPKSYELGCDLPYGHSIENRISTPESVVMGKRPPNGLNVGPIPTKRVRTASRQRVVGPFSTACVGIIPVPSRTDASSGDTNSFQDEQSTLHGGSVTPRGFEVESGMDFDKQATFDSTEVGVKPKKKKKTKRQLSSVWYQGAAYDQRWHVEANMQNEQKDHFKKRLETQQVEYTGSGGPFGPHAKKLKTMKQFLDNSCETTSLMSGSAASAVASQMSNMSNPNKLIKLISVRDRGRKAKALKIPSGQTGSGSPWSLFEDQALVVLVHDMGPNWELVSDAINSTLHFKCIFRKPKECKERHKILIEKSCGDGADSAEDSGSSQPYPSTLPGIPKGGARQLFQQLRGPIEEDTIKSHFEKIILLGQKLHARKKQEPKHLVAVHGSHLAALSQILPNNGNGVALTPLYICDMAVPSPDVFAANYQGPHSSGLPLANQATVQSMLPSSGTNSSLQSSPGMGLGGNLRSLSAQPNGPVRDERYSVPRTSLPIDEQQRVQQYNRMLSGRIIRQTNMPIPGAFSGNDRGVRIVPVGNGVVMPGMNGSMSMPRPGFQGISSSSMLKSGSTVASNMVKMPSSVNIYSGASQGNPMLQPCDASHMVRPGQNSEHQMHMMSSEMKLQATQTNDQGVASFGGSSSTFPNQSASPSSYPAHHQNQHQISQQRSTILSNSHYPHLQGSAHPVRAEQQAFAMRLERERQRMLQRQQHQHFPSSSPLMSHVPTKSHLSISSATQNSSQIQSPASSQLVALPPQTPSSPVTSVTSQQQLKHQLQHHGLDRARQTGPGGMINHGGKLRQRQAQQLQQQLPQSGRHQPSQCQPPQSQQVKLLEGMEKGNNLTHQSLPVEASHINGLSNNAGSEMDKGEQALHLMQGQGYTTQSSKSLVPPSSIQPHPQQKLYTNSAPTSSKLLQQMPSDPDSSSQSQISAVMSASSVPTSNQSMQPPVMRSLIRQQLKVHPSPPVKLVKNGQLAVQRTVSQNCVVNSDLLSKPQNDQIQADQPFTSDTSLSVTPGISPSSVESTDAVPIASSSGPAHWKTLDPMSDLMIPISSNQLGPIGCSSMPKSPGNESLASGGQGPSQRQPSGSLLSHGHVAGTQWQQQQQLQQPPRGEPSQPQKQSQQQQQQQALEYSSKRQPLQHQHPQLQVQTAQNNFTGSSRSSLE